MASTEKQPLLASHPKIRPARLADVRVITSVVFDTFQGAPFWVQHFKPAKGDAATPADLEERDRGIYRVRLAGTRRHLCSPDISTYLAYTDESDEKHGGQPAALAIWALHAGEQTGHKALKHRRRPLSIWQHVLRAWYKVIDAVLPKILPDWLQAWLWYPQLGTAYMQRRRNIMQEQEETENMYMLEEDKARGYVVLYMLGTLPRYERRGIGAALLREGIDRAVEDGVAIFLTATEAGRGLYKRMGFETLGERLRGPPGAQWVDTAMRHPGGTRARDADHAET